MPRGSLAGVNWRQGQNLLMALAVVALLVLVVPLTLSGDGSYNDWGDVLGGEARRAARILRRSHPVRFRVFRPTSFQSPFEI